LLTKESLAQQEQMLKTLGAKLAELQVQLDKGLQARDGVKDEAGQLLYRNLEHPVTETKKLVDAALEKCGLLKTGEVPLSEDSSAELMQMVSQIITNSTAFTKETSQWVNAKGVPTGGLDTLSGTEFEGLITRLLERMGFRAEMTKASGDGGIDIVATLDQPVTGGRYLIQCKRYAQDSPVGAAAVREFYGALTADRHAVKGILITTSGFTAQAQEFAGELPIELIGRDQLQRLLEKHGLHTEVLSPHPGDTEGESPQPKDRVAELMDLAGKMRDQKRYAEAIKLLREAARLRPDNPDVWLWLGICYNIVGLHDDQIAAIREALRLKPDFQMAWHFFGIGLQKVGELDAAIDAFTRANTIQSDDVYTWIELGRAYDEKGNKEGAIFAAQKAVKLKPDLAIAWLDLGLHHWEAGQTTEALSAFREVVRIDPNNAHGWNFLCIVYRKLGDRARLLQAINRLEQLDPATARKWRDTSK
jgi:Flp pilus assembly protein TadD/HJR/Mrr/RecB family endonuclease